MSIDVELNLNTGIGIVSIEFWYLIFLVFFLYQISYLLLCFVYLYFPPLMFYSNTRKNLGYFFLIYTNTSNNQIYSNLVILNLHHGCHMRNRNCLPFRNSWVRPRFSTCISEIPDIDTCHINRVGHQHT
jgi:hypothetical protein